MTNNVWLDVCSRLSPSEPIDLDQKIANLPSSASAKIGIVGFPLMSESTMVPSTVIWSFDNVDTVCLGIRVTQPIENYARAAARLVAVAVERSVTPIILTSLPYSGFERFGFRVERLVGETNEELIASEEELKRFWRIDVVINLSDVIKLG